VILTFRLGAAWLTLAIVVRDTVLSPARFLIITYTAKWISIHLAGQVHTFAAFALFIVVLTHAAG